MTHCVLCLGGSEVEREVKSSHTVEWIWALTLGLNPIFALSKCWFGLWIEWMCLSDAGSHPNIPVGKTHDWFKPLGSENTSRYQKCQGWIKLCHYNPEPQSATQVLNFNTRDLEVKSRKKKGVLTYLGCPKRSFIPSFGGFVMLPTKSRVTLLCSKQKST